MGRILIAGVYHSFDSNRFFPLLRQRVLELLARAIQFWLEDKAWLQKVTGFSLEKKRVYIQELTQKFYTQGINQGAQDTGFPQVSSIVAELIPALCLWGMVC